MSRLQRDPLTGDVVSLAAARQGRPLTQGAGASCPFCPGPTADVGSEPFWVAVFQNRFPVFRNPGEALVVVYSSHHHDDLAWLPPVHRDAVWSVWAKESHSLSLREDIEAVYVFENRGAKIGATIAHPHGQIYGFPYIPPRLGQELGAFLGSACPLCREPDPALMVAEAAHWTLSAPVAMRLPYEVWMIPRRHVRALDDLSDAERREGASLMQSMLRAYDRLFGHRAALALGCLWPARGADGYHVRWSFMPVERGGGRLKYIAGSELGAGAFLTDVLPEDAASRLKRAWEEVTGQHDTR